MKTIFIELLKKGGEVLREIRSDENIKSFYFVKKRYFFLSRKQLEDFILKHKSN